MFCGLLILLFLMQSQLPWGTNKVDVDFITPPHSQIVSSPIHLSFSLSLPPPLSFILLPPYSCCLSFSPCPPLSQFKLQTQ